MNMSPARTTRISSIACFKDPDLFMNILRIYAELLDGDLFSLFLLSMVYSKVIALKTFL